MPWLPSSPRMSFRLFPGTFGPDPIAVFCVKLARSHPNPKTRIKCPTLYIATQRTQEAQHTVQQRHPLHPWPEKYGAISIKALKATAPLLRFT